MKVKVVSVSENRGVRKDQDRLVVVPDSHSYVVELELEDGRFAYLTGSGDPPFDREDFLVSHTSR